VKNERLKDLFLVLSRWILRDVGLVLRCKLSEQARRLARHFFQRALFLSRLHRLARCLSRMVPSLRCRRSGEGGRWLFLGPWEGVRRMALVGTGSVGCVRRFGLGNQDERSGLRIVNGWSVFFVTHD
jgi:hypothetical protein